MIVAFCGVDGSGKTTLSRRLREDLVRRGHSAVVIEPFRYVIWRPFLKLLDGGGRLVSASGEKKNRFFLFKFWPILALFDHWVQFLFRIKPLEKKYDYVIADRFFFDFAASFAYFGYTTDWLDNVYLKLVPKPDITFVLDLSPDAALKREKGGRHSLDFFSRQQRYYSVLVEKFGLQGLDTSIAIQELTQRVLETVLK